MLTRVRLRKIAILALKTAKTNAGENVHEYDWPTSQETSPAILFNKDSETKHSLNRSQPIFNTVATLSFDVRVIEKTRELARKGIDELLDQIELAILTNYDLRQQVQQFLFVNSDGGIDSNTGKHVAHYTIAFGLEFFEDQNQYPALPAVPLNEMDVTIGKSRDDPGAKTLVFPDLQT